MKGESCSSEGRTSYSSSFLSLSLPFRETSSKLMWSDSSHTLLSNLGINTSHLSHTISNLPTDQSQTPKFRRRRHAPSTSRLAPLGDMGPSYAMRDTDVEAWGRNWHEMIILSGIEMQRQRVRSLPPLPLRNHV